MRLHDLLNGANPLIIFLYLVIGLLSAFLIKQLFFHPLASYPGPFLGRITSLYAAYHAWRGTLHIDMYRCHQKYDIHAHAANTIKSKAYQALVHSAPNTLTIRHKADHARRRRILSLAFSDSRMLSYQSIVLRHVNALCDNLEEIATREGGGSVNMSLQSDYFTFDVMSEVIFGMAYNALGDSKYRFVTRALEASNVRISALVQSSLLVIGRLDKYLFPKSIVGRNKFLGFIGSLLRDRSKASFADNGNVFSFLETAKDPDGGNELSKSEIRAECATLVVAGSDTSSSTLAGTLFYLSRNPQAYDRVCREVRSEFQDAQHITIGPKLSSCVYLRACIEETLRLSPPVGGALWREIGPGGMNVGSLSLPAGIDVGTGIYSLHHNSTYHSEPFKYLPERWIVGEGSSTSKSVEVARSAFSPFSRGPRSCVGKGFAYHELSLTIAHIIHRFEFSTADDDISSRRLSGGPGGTDEFLLRDHVTGAKSGPLLRFSLRA
ncbi:cytochrome P450 [Fusarium flagelliforme]|uniref:cytochrome P450 n=1 Tax=Fusarium flagelliforme TaxID=2675880 RepID=UPI001E8D34D9|nr:cytochrome P450 [Fusarium flagelliforme]KAH7173133.1 cytochrome P450 [Fusarium flagelliforme]